jgi:hypothetical protein
MRAPLALVLLCAFATVRADLSSSTSDAGVSARLDVETLFATCPHDAGGGRCQARVLRNVCLVQETVIVFDADAADAHPDGVDAGPLSGFDVTDVAWWYRHAGPAHVDEVLHAPPHPHNHSSTVLGHQINYPPIAARYAAPHEFDASPVFNDVTTPVVVYSPWLMNLAETAIRVPTLLMKLEDAWTGARVAAATPLKLPIDSFVKSFIAPFTDEETTSFAELSALRMDSNLTEHEACYSNVVFLKVKNGAYPELPALGQRIAQFYETVTPPSPWKTSDASVTRIVFETRPNKSMRQFIGLEEVLDACAREASLECAAHEFGSSLQADISRMKHADVLVAYHGAGETNSIFMHRHAAILEIRGKEFGTKHGWWAAFWWCAPSSCIEHACTSSDNDQCFRRPMISQQTEQNVFFWGLNVEATALNTNSPLEQEGLEHNEGFNARDRFVTLQWGYLVRMLNKVITVKRDVAAYRNIYGQFGAGVVFTWTGEELVQEPPIFCNDKCTHESLECKKC